MELREAFNSDGEPILTRLHGKIDEEKLYICRPIPNTDKKEFAPVGILKYRINEATEDEWSIEPLWENYGPDSKYKFDLEDDEIFGINMDLRKKEYVSYEIPAIVEKRIPPRGREDLVGLFRKMSSNYYDTIDILRVTNGLSVDKFIFTEIESDKTEYILDNEIMKIREEFYFGR